MNHQHLILYAEDDADDILLLQSAFAKYRQSVNLVVVQHGADALQYLNAVPDGGLLPCLIILDINMPKMDGKQTLAQLKSNARFKHLPVILFTTSSGAIDKLFAAKWGAELITKPFKMDDIQLIVDLFFKHCADGEK